MRLSVASVALAGAFVLTPVIAGYTPALSQDFSITNQESSVNAGRRDLMRQLQAWWDVHAYYPKHASNNDEGGTVKLHLEILPDGRIWTAHVAESSGSSSLDMAGTSAFRLGFVRPFPAGVPEADMDIAVHYVLAHRHDQAVAAGFTPVSSKSPFTITNDPIESPILEKMLLRTCTGEVVKQGIRNHPWYGVHYWAQAIFFRRPDGTPWVKFYEGGYSILAPVTVVGNVVQWIGREEHHQGRGGGSRLFQYAVWPDGDNKLSGNIDSDIYNNADLNRGGTVGFTCASEVVPPIEWNAWYVNIIQHPPGDPP